MVVTIPDLSFSWIIPEVIVAAVALTILLIAAFSGRNDLRRLSGFLALAGACLALVYTAALWNESEEIFYNLYAIDNFATFFKAILLIIAVLVVILSLRYGEREEIAGSEYYALLLFGLLGMMVMVSSNNFITIFVGLEIMSISLYVLCGLLAGNLKSAEASFKYFLLGAFATAFLLYGMAFIYAATGSLDISEIGEYVVSGTFYLTPMFMAGVAFLIVGFGFKTASVPFHMWTPDVYEGAPTPVTAYMATGVKAASFGAFLRVFYTALIPFLSGWSGILWLIAVLTMTAGNVTALVQDNVKRMLAYSSIAHAGYILIAFVTGDRQLSSSILYYLTAYAFMNIGAFTVVLLLESRETGDTDIGNFAGLAARRPFLAFCMSVILLSLAGVPPLAGFMGKFYVFSAAVKAEYYWLAVIGVLNSAVAAYYYLRVMMYMYFREAGKEREPVALDSSPAYMLVIVICVWALFHLGIFPRQFLLLAQKSVDIFI